MCLYEVLVARRKLYLSPLVKFAYDWKRWKEEKNESKGTRTFSTWNKYKCTKIYKI